MKLVVKALYIITEMLLGEDGDVFIVYPMPNTSTHPCQVMTVFF